MRLQDIKKHILGDKNNWNEGDNSFNIGSLKYNNKKKYSSDFYNMIYCNFSISKPGYQTHVDTLAHTLDFHSLWTT